LEELPREYDPDTHQLLFRISEEELAELKKKGEPVQTRYLNNTEGQGTYNADLLEQSVWVQIMDLTSGTLQHFQKKVVKVNKFAVLFVGKEGNADDIRGVDNSINL